MLVRQTLGGWNLSSAIRIASGLPLPNPVSFYNNPLGNFGFPGPGLPDLVGDPRPHHRNKTNWIDPAAFQGVDYTGTVAQRCDVTVTDQDGNPQLCQPFQYRYGNEPAHANQLREANNDNVDLGIAKVFGTEKFHTELRGDFLNLFNHPIYGGGNISTCLNCGDLGTVYGTRNDPRAVQVSLKISY
jgi:hypothetical protein